MSINFKSKAQLWFPTTIFQVTLDDMSKKIINDEIMIEIKDYLNNPETKKSLYVNTDTNLHKSKLDLSCKIAQMLFRFAQ